MQKRTNDKNRKLYLQHQQLLRQKNKQAPPQVISSYIRTILLIAAAAFYVPKTLFHPDTDLYHFLFPHGMAQSNDDHVLEWASIDHTNTLLQIENGKTKKIIERRSKSSSADDEERDEDGILKDTLIRGPETVISGPKGELFLMTDESKLLQMSDLEPHPTQDGVLTAKLTVVRESLGNGRPLGGRFASDGTLYIADAILGLTRIPKNVLDEKKHKLEIVTTHAVDAEGGRHKMNFMDDVTIGPKSGKVYFTDASNVSPDYLLHKNYYDCWHAAKLDLLRGGSKGTGRLLEYDPTSDTTKILADGLFFANGIAVDKEEQYLVFAESTGINIVKYHLQGPQAGTLEVIVPSSKLPFYLDGVDCSWKTGLCYAIGPSSVTAIHKFTAKLPDTISMILRNFFMILPRDWAPDAEPFASIVEFDPKQPKDDGTFEFRFIQDPTGKDLRMLTGVTEQDGKLYLGSLANKYVGVYTL